MEALHSKKLYLLLAAVGLLVNAVTLWTWDISLTSNDGIQYISTAKNWLAGHGFATDILMYSPHFQGTFPAAQTVWPTGYPLAIALVSKLGLSLPHAALAINLIMHAIASVLIWLILRRLEITNRFAVLSAFCFYVLALPWNFVSAASAEPLFTVLLLAATLFLPDIKRSGLATWVVCGLFIAAAVYVRYSAVFFAASTGAGIFIAILIHDRSNLQQVIKQCFKLALLIALPLVAFLHLMYRTNTLVGTLNRYSGTKQPVPFLETMHLWFAKSSELLGFGSSTTVPSSITTPAFIVFAIIVMIPIVLILARYKLWLKNSGTENSRMYFYTLTLVVIAHSAAVVLYLSIMSMSTTPLEVLTRYIYQFYPGLYPIFCFILYALINNFGKENHRENLKTNLTMVAPGIIGALAIIYLLAQINSTVTSRPLYFRGYLDVVQMMKLPVTENRNLTEYTINCINQHPVDKSVWSTHGHKIHFHTGVPTVTHTAIYATKPFDSNFLQQQIKDYKLGMFFFVTMPGKFGETYDNYMRDMRIWLEENGYAKIPMQNNQFTENGFVDVYAANPECGI